jgi:hypothetical protein
MGNQISSQNSKDKPKHMNVNFGSGGSSGSGFVLGGSISSYKGVKTDVSCESIKCEKDLSSTNCTINCVSNESTIATESKIEEVKEVKVSTVFQWKEGGGTVFMTGSFCNWNQKFLMGKVNNNYEVVLVRNYLIILGSTAWSISI